MNEDWVYSRRTGCGLLYEDHTQLNSDIYGYHVMQECRKSFILLLRVWFFWPTWATSLHFLLPLIPGSHCLSLVFEFNFILFYCACVWSCVYGYVQTCVDTRSQNPSAVLQARSFCLFCDNVFQRGQEFAEEAGLPVEGSIPSYLVHDRRTSTFHHAQFLCRF